VHHHKNSVADNSTGDIGPDSFHKFDEDLKALKIVGVNI
jgi:beta-glucosidase/6-phospho-beta-glucosidase/beta-galactosidase